MHNGLSEKGKTLMVHNMRWFKRLLLNFLEPWMRRLQSLLALGWNSNHQSLFWPPLMPCKGQKSTSKESDFWVVFFHCPFLLPIFLRVVDGILTWHWHKKEEVSFNLRLSGQHKTIFSFRRAGRPKHDLKVLSANIVSLLLTRSVVDHQCCIHLKSVVDQCWVLHPLCNFLWFWHTHVCAPSTPHYSFGPKEQKATPQRCAVIFSQVQGGIQGVWEQRRYQQPHTKIPSAKESALFSDVVRVSYGIASSPHKITLKPSLNKIIDNSRPLFLLVNTWQGWFG